MNERTEIFEVAGMPRLVLRLPSGEVRVVAGEPGQVVVRARASESDLGRLLITGRGSTVSVEAERSGWGRWAALDVEIAVGAAPEISCRQDSGELLLRTTVAEVDCASASGCSAGVYQPQLYFSTKALVQPGLVTMAGVPQARLS